MLSVYNKDGIVDFAKELVQLGWNLIASGGTRKVLIEAGLDVHAVADLVGGEAILDHRVVTLSREIHAGLLARDCEEDWLELNSKCIPWIDLVCLDFYPLEEAIEDPDANEHSVIEKTDIGGPALLRSASKGRRLIATDESDRDFVIQCLKEGSANDPALRTALASKAEITCAKYSALSAQYHSGDMVCIRIGEEVNKCGYGENPVQADARVYSHNGNDPLAIDRFELVKGNEPSYNNICDIDRVLQTITHIAAVFEQNIGTVPLIAVGVKHGNACGAAYGDDPVQVIQRMIEGSPTDIMGGCVMTNFAIDKELGTLLRVHKCNEGKRPLDVVVAPGYSDEAIKALARPKGACKRLQNPALESIGLASLDQKPRTRYIRGGFLLQPNYTFVPTIDLGSIEVIGENDDSHLKPMILAWAIGATSNSNTCTLVHPDGYIIGNGTGQQSRVEAVRLAVDKALSAGHSCEGSIGYTDSFFPFIDGPEEARKARVKAFFLPTGSRNDKEVIQFFRENGMTAYLMPASEVRGFYAH